MARKIIDTPDPAVAWAEKLWGQLATSLLATEKLITQIIHDKAWEPLGYHSFTEAWAARMADTRLGGELRAHVVYAMLREGSTPENVAAAINGISHRVAEQLADEMAAGVPASSAGQRRRPRDPSPFKTVFVPVPRATHAKWERIAKSNDTTLGGVAFAALSEAMSEMGEP